MSSKQSVDADLSTIKFAVGNILVGSFYVFVQLVTESVRECRAGRSTRI